MGILADLFGDAMFEGRPVPHTGPEAARLVSVLYGSGRAASRALGIPESTLRGWRKGVTPKGESAQKIQLLARAAAPGIRDAYDGSSKLAIKATVQFSGDRRDRIIHPGRYIPRPLMRRIITTWVQGKDRTVETLLHNAIQTHYFNTDATEALVYMQPTDAWFE